MKGLVALVVVWILAVGVYEFRILKRPSLAHTDAVIAETPAPAFALAQAVFACAAEHGFASSLQVSGTSASADCTTGFSEATTRCASNLPLLGFGDQIKCSAGEQIHCHGGPLQTVGLFKDDSFCGDVSDRDLGPPQEAPRVDD